MYIRCPIRSRDGQFDSYLAAFVAHLGNNNND